MPYDHLAQLFLEVKQLGRFFGGNLHQRNASPHGNDLGDVVLAYCRGGCAIPTSLKNLKFLFQLELLLGQSFHLVIIELGIRVT